MSTFTFYSPATVGELSRAEALFTLVFGSIDKKLEYSTSWENGTGYFDRACYSVKLAAGEVATSVDTHGRRMIFVGMPGQRTVVVFQRYKGLISTNNPLVVNEDSMLTQLFGFSASKMTEEDFKRLFGFVSEHDLEMTKRNVLKSNFGHQLADFMEYTGQRENSSFYNMQKLSAAQQSRLNEGQTN